MDVEGAKERSDSKFGYTKVSKSRLYQRKNGTIGAQQNNMRRMDLPTSLDESLH
jgi:hypothetical protein